MAAEQITYKDVDPKVRKKIMFGPVFMMFIACFDGTIVGTCGPVIARDLNGTDLYSWMVTAYMLCETIMIPIAGKLSDLYGRKPLFLIGLVLFAAGSFVAGMSTNMLMLISCRAVQGLGGGILIPVAIAAVADLYAPQDRAKMQGLLGAVFGIGSGIGPLFGGYITEYISWHWIFYINIPLAILAYVITIRNFPSPVMGEKPIIDVRGITFLSLFLLDILLFFEWGGDEVAWVSAESASMIAIATVLLAMFVMVERRAREPILSPDLLKNKTVISAAVFMFVFGLAMMGVMMYSSMFAITIFGITTLEAGEYSLALVFGMMITATLSGAFVNKTGYRPWLIAGPIISAVGLFYMSHMDMDTTMGYYLSALFVFGIGLGCIMAVVMTAVQNSSKPSEMGMTISAVNLIRSVGATIGTAVFAFIISGKLNSELANKLPPDAYAALPHDAGVLDALATVTDPAIIIGVLESFANSIDYAFLLGGTIIACLAVIGTAFKAPKAEPYRVLSALKASQANQPTL